MTPFFICGNLKMEVVKSGKRMALYSAKSQGRNRALGIATSPAVAFELQRAFYFKQISLIQCH